MKVYMYILYSKSLQKYYAGISKNVKERLSEHNSGKGNFTSKGTPWEVVVSIECASRSDAMKLEKTVKKRGIKRYLQDNNLL